MTAAILAALFASAFITGHVIVTVRAFSQGKPGSGLLAALWVIAGIAVALGFFEWATGRCL